MFQLKPASIPPPDAHAWEPPARRTQRSERSSPSARAEADRIILKCKCALCRHWRANTDWHPCIRLQTTAFGRPLTPPRPIGGFICPNCNRWLDANPPEPPSQPIEPNPRLARLHACACGQRAILTVLLHREQRIRRICATCPIPTHSTVLATHE